METQKIIRTGKTGLTITSLSALEAAADTSDATIVIASEDLKAALWEPEVDHSPESPEPWGGWMWGFQLTDGTQAVLTNDRRGGIRWSLWVENTSKSGHVLEALLDVISGAGFEANISQF